MFHSSPVAPDTTDRGRRVLRRRLTLRRLAGAAGALGVAATLASAAAPATPAEAASWRLLVNESSGKAMQVRGASKLEYWIDQGVNRAADHQLWSMPDKNQTGSILNKRSRMCLTTTGIAGQSLYQTYCDGRAGQRWTTGSYFLWTDIEPPFGDIVYWFRNPASGLVIDVIDGSSDDAARIIGQPGNNSAHQTWLRGEPR